MQNARIGCHRVAANLDTQSAQAQCPATTETVTQQSRTFEVETTDRLIGRGGVCDGPHLVVVPRPSDVGEQRDIAPLAQWNGVVNGQLTIRQHIASAGNVERRVRLQYDRTAPV